MTTTEQAYQRFIIKINENATTDRVSCDKGRFCVVFNNQQNKLIEYYYERKFEDDGRYIQKILVDDKKLTSSNKHLDHEDFKLPKNYFDFSNLYVKATKGKCKDRVDCTEIKDDDRNYILSNNHRKPSFKYRETPFHLSSDNIKIYTSDEFTIDAAYLSYYRYPVQVGLLNPEDPESDFTNNNPEFDDKFINRVIDLATAEFLLNVDDPKFQALKANAAQKI